MSADIQITICGDVERERTVAELSHADSGNFIGLVYEDPDGWKEEIQERPLPEPVRAAIECAREKLRNYINRRGEKIPPGLTAAGLSLWLMEKDDGTAMGRPVGS